MNLPSATVTFLLTDIEGSTRLWEEQPDGMRLALARHDELASSVVAEFAGVLLKSRGEGDSLFAVFPLATDAVAAAFALQTVYTHESWTDSVPLRARMAVHTGEASLRDGDYYGPAVNRCARLRAIGHGGQVLLSGVTHDLCRDSLPSGCSGWAALCILCRSSDSQSTSLCADPETIHFLDGPPYDALWQASA